MWTTMQNLEDLAWKMSYAILVYTHKCHAPRSHTPFEHLCQFLWVVIVNYQATILDPSLKNDWVLPILVYTHKCHAP